ncbi:hypothetical protein KQX54_010614, partial [Cotesia glomerata]
FPRSRPTKVAGGLAFSSSFSWRPFDFPGFPGELSIVSQCRGALVYPLVQALCMAESSLPPTIFPLQGLISLKLLGRHHRI